MIFGALVRLVIGVLFLTVLLPVAAEAEAARRSAKSSPPLYSRWLPITVPRSRRKTSTFTWPTSPTPSCRISAAKTSQKCRADPEFCIGEPLPNASVSADNVVIDDETATAVIDSEIGPFGIELIRENDVWKANGLFVPDDEIAAGTEIVEVELIEFAFVGELASETVQSGDFAFRFVNNGEQTHEAVLVELPADGTLEELLSDESFQPEPVFVKFAYGPGEQSDVALPQTLAAGRYGLICFLPDTTEGPDGTPHAFKGMVAEFTVG